MTVALKAGGKVQWHLPQGAVQGTVKEKLTSPVTATSTTGVNWN